MMWDEIVKNIVIVIVIASLVYQLFVKPSNKKRKYDKRLRDRVLKLRELGIKDPNLSKKEIELLNSDELPNDDDILKYYKMYLKKFEINTEDQWTTAKPRPFDDWERIAKTPTKRHISKNSKFGFQVAGGWLFMISCTCDAMIGIPPNQVYHRYHDYEAMVKEDDEKFLKELEEQEQ